MSTEAVESRNLLRAAASIKHRHLVGVFRNPVGHGSLDELADEIGSLGVSLGEIKALRELAPVVRRGIERTRYGGLLQIGVGRAIETLLLGWIADIYRDKLSICDPFDGSVSSCPIDSFFASRGAGFRAATPEVLGRLSDLLAWRFPFASIEITRVEFAAVAANKIADAVGCAAAAYLAVDAYEPMRMALEAVDLSVVPGGCVVLATREPLSGGQMALAEWSKNRPVVMRSIRPGLQWFWKEWL